MGDEIIDGFLKLCVVMSPGEMKLDDLSEVEYILKSKLKQLEQEAMDKIEWARENRKFPNMRLVK